MTPEYSIQHTVMGLAKSHSMLAFLTALCVTICVTEKAPKSHYREILGGKIKRLNGMAQFDGKVKGILQTAGYHISENCDILAQDELMEVEAFGTLRLDGQSEDPSRSSLVETVINFDLPTEIVQQEVDLPQNIYLCTRKHDELLITFAIRLNSMIPQYSVQTAELDASICRKFVVLMIQNSNSSNDTR